jgi:hypothetical protein
MNLDERIRERAYQLWEAEGKPEGQDFEHWLRAREEVEPGDEEGDSLAGGVESSVAIPMPRSATDD